MPAPELDPVFRAPALWFLGLDALAILAVYVAAREGRGPRWGAIVLRVFAALGLLVPGWTVLGWYGELSAAREWARDVPLRTEPIVGQFVTASVTLVSLGFLVLIGGIFLARRVGRPSGEVP